MSNRTLLILLGFVKSMKKRVVLSEDNNGIVKAVAYNMALEDTVLFLQRLIDNKISPEAIKAYLMENEK